MMNDEPLGELDSLPSRETEVSVNPSTSIDVSECVEVGLGKDGALLAWLAMWLVVWNGAFILLGSD